jgi:hypothetical protein
MSGKAIVGAFLLTLSSPALADPSPSATAGDPASAVRLPVALAERPLTVPRFILEPDIEADVTRIEPNATYGNLGIGASFGVTDYLGVRAIVLPLQLAGPPGNGFHYGQTSEDRGPGVGATLAFVHGRVMRSRASTAPSATSTRSSTSLISSCPARAR